MFSKKGKGCQVFVGGLSPDTDADGLRKMFAEVGGIAHITIFKDPETGRSKGAGKVEFDTTDLAQKAVAALRGPSAPGHISFATVFTDHDTSQIDVQYDKAVEWLASRSKLQENWAAALSGIQAKASLLSAAEDLDYFKVEELWNQRDGKEKEACKQVLDLYKRSNTHMVEAARSLVQRVRYDIPSANSQAQACQKQLQDTERRQKDLSKQEIEVKRKLQEMCDAHKIKGVDFEAELQDNLRTALPKFLENAASKIKASCPEALKFYRAFLSENGGGAEMPLLGFVVAKGNALLKDAADLNAELKAEWKRVQALKTGGDEKMLSNSCARGLVVDELMELDAFFAQRCLELEERGGTEETKNLQKKISEVLESLCGKDVQPILLMHSSESTLSHAVSKLSAQRALCERPSKESSALGLRKTELSKEADISKKEVALFQAQAKHLKGWLEDEMSRLMHYKVRLAGGDIA